MSRFYVHRLAIALVCVLCFWYDLLNQKLARLQAWDSDTNHVDGNDPNWSASIFKHISMHSNMQFIRYGFMHTDLLKFFICVCVWFFHVGTAEWEARAASRLGFRHNVDGSSLHESIFIVSSTPAASRTSDIGLRYRFAFGAGSVDPNFASHDRHFRRWEAFGHDVEGTFTCSVAFGLLTWASQIACTLGHQGIICKIDMSWLLRFHTGTWLCCRGLFFRVFLRLLGCSTQHAWFV